MHAYTARLFCPSSSEQSGKAPTTIAARPQNSPLVLFRSWTIVYDTIYACQDRADDVLVGIKSTAVLFGTYVRPILVLFTLAFLLLLVYAGVANGQSFGYFAVSCAGAAGHFLWQFWTWNPDVPAEGGAKFQVSVSTVFKELCEELTVVCCDDNSRTV